MFRQKMANNLQKRLENLHEIAKYEDQQDEVQRILDDISLLSSRKVTLSKLNYDSSLLLKDDTGLLSFISKINNDKAFLKCKEVALTIVYDYICKIRELINPYISDVRRTCVHVIRIETSSIVKEKAYKILSKIIKLCPADDSTKLECDFLYNLVYKELGKTKKAGAKVRGRCFSILGKLAEFHQASFVDKSDRIFETLLRELEINMTTSSKMELPVIVGCINGLRRIMTTFPRPFDRYNDLGRKIFKFTLLALNPTDTLKTFNVPKAALKLFSNHMSQFGLLLCENYQGTYESYMRWFSHNNPRMQHEAYLALSALFQQIAMTMCSEDDTGVHRNLFKFFVSEFERLLAATDVSEKQLSLVVRGYGAFASPCRRYMPGNQLKWMLVSMTTRCESIYFSSDGRHNGAYQLPSFLESLSLIVRELSVPQVDDNVPTSDISIPDSFIVTLSKLTLLLVQKFPVLNRKFSFHAQRSILMVLSAFIGKPEVMDGFVTDIVHQGLIHTFSHDILLQDDTFADVSDKQTDIRTDTRTVTYKDFLPLWCGLLKPTQDKTFGMKRSTSELQVQEIVTNKIFDSIFQITNKLNLTIKKINTETQDSIEAENLSDFKIFINLSGFFEDFMFEISREKSFEDSAHFAIVSRIYELAKHFVKLSNRCPMVSGFYRMLTALLKVGQTLCYFVRESMDVSSVDGTSQPQEHDKCAALIRSFATEVILRSRNLHDEILSSALHFLFSLPAGIAQSLLRELVLPLQRAFEMGLSYTSLASAALVAMETWQNALSMTVVIGQFQQVLPYLEPYLHATVDRTDQSESLTSKRKSRMNDSKFDMESERNKLQQKVMKYLGSLGGHIHSCVSKGQSSEVMSWTTDVEIPFSIPFTELKADIDIASLLPRVTYLALHSTGRQTKVCACELLHALSVYIIGWNAPQDRSTQTKKPVDKIFKKLFPVIIRLACDLEMVTRQLFDPLLMQCVHWFTNNRKYESSDSMQLLNALVDGLSDKQSATVQEKCSVAVKEYLLWSIKQNKGHDSARNNAKSLFKRLFNLATHASPDKRLGASMAMNKLYTVFREQPSLVDEFTLEMLVIFLNSLSLSYADSKDAQEQTVQVTKHLKRIIIQKSDVLNQQSKRRRRPLGFPQNVHVTLNNVVDWLVKQFARAETECRRQCIDLFYWFVPLTVGKPTAKRWIDEKMKQKGEIFIVNCIEGRYCNNDGISKFIQPLLLKDRGVLKALLAWSGMILATLDSLLFLIDQKLLHPKVITENSSSNIIKCVEYFLEKLADKNLEEARELFDEKSQHSFSSRDCESFSHLKCSVIVQILQLFISLSQSHKEYVPKMFSAVSLDGICRVIVTLLFSEDKLGFSSEMDETTSNKLTELLQLTIPLVEKYLSKEEKSKFCKNISEELNKNGKLIGIATSIFDTSRRVNYDVTMQIIEAYQLVQRTKLLVQVVADVDDASLAIQLLDCIFNGITTKEDELDSVNYLSPNTTKLANKLLELVFQFGVTDHLIKLISNRDEIYSGQNKLATSRGLVFFSTFKSAISIELCTKSSKYIPAISCSQTISKRTKSEVFYGVLDILTSNRSLRKAHSGNVCKVVLAQFTDTLDMWWKVDSADDLMVVTTVMRKVLILDNSVVKYPVHPSYKSFLQMYAAILHSPSLTLDLKSKALEILSFFTLTSSQDRLNALKKILQIFASKEFPMKWKEFSKGTKEFVAYESAVNCLLNTLKLTSNPMVLEVLLPIFCREDDHFLLEEFKSSLKHCMTKSSNHSKLLQVGMRWLDTDDVPKSVQCRAVNTVVLPLITQCTKNTAVEFFTNNINKIMAIVLEKPQRFSDETWQPQLWMKMCAYKLMEVFFTLLSADDVKMDSAPVVKTFFKEHKVPLLKTFMKQVNIDKNEDMSGEKRLLEDRRLFHCAVYNATIAAIVCTQTEVKWFDAFVFCNKPESNQFLFDNLIDKSREYKLSLQLDKPLETRKKFIAIRKTAKSKDEDQEQVAYIPSLNYSSLSEEAGKFDFNLTRTIQGSLQNTEELASLASSEPRPVRDTDGDVIELEADQLNDHECMSNIVGLITHMHQQNIGFPSHGNTNMPLPHWLQTIVNKLDHPKTELNVKMFIAKLISNLEDVFKPYAAHFLNPMIKVVIATLKCEHAEEAISNFVIDVLTSLLSWSSVAIPKNDAHDQAICRGLVELLMQNIHNPVRAVMRHNLDLLKTVIEVWRSRVNEINTGIINDQIQSSDRSAADNFCGLQILGALLANGHAPYTPSYNLQREEYFKRIISNLLSSRKEIYETAAEVIGLSLKYMEDKEHETSGEIHNMVNEALLNLVNTGKSGVWQVGVFANCLRKIAQHFPSAASMQFITRIFFELPKISGGSIRHDLMEIVLIRCDVIEDLHTNLKHITFLSMLTHRDDRLQLTCLKICLALYQACTNNEQCLQAAEYFLPTVQGIFIDHTSVLCRQQMYEIAMTIFDSLSITSNEVESQDKFDEIQLMSKRMLVTGLYDSDELLSTQVQNFWTDEQNSRLPVNISLKIPAIFSQLFHADVDGFGFLSSTCNLVLQTTSKSSDFNRPVFMQPLSECTFQEQTIDHRWQQRNSSMTPLFADTLHSTHSSLGSLQTTASRPNNMLEATQVDMEFSATVDARGTFNWLTGGSVDTFSTLNADALSVAPSSALLAVKTKTPQKFSKVPVAKDFGKKLLGSGDHKRVDEDSSELKQDISRLRRRFLKSSASDKYKFANIAERKRRSNEVLQKQTRRKKEHGVKLYRTYRAGDLPDIEIPYKGLISPLAALAQLDTKFTQKLTANVINAVIKERMSNGGEDYAKMLSKSFIELFSKGIDIDPVFLKCIFEIILQNCSNIFVDPNLIGTVANLSKQQTLGIRLLEEWILVEEEHEANSPPTSKQSRSNKTSSSSPKLNQLWMELSRLYTSQNEMEILHGIFEASPIQRIEFSNSLQQQMEGNYKQALTCYQRLLAQEEWDNPPSEVEQDLWEDCVINCLQNMSRWDKVTEFCERNLQTNSNDMNMNALWSDDRMRQMYMQPLLQSKFLLFLESSEDALKHGEEVKTFFNENITTSNQRKNIIENHFAEQLALLFCHNDDFDRCQHYLKLAQNNISALWSNTDKAMQSDTANLLHHLTQISEAMDFCQLMKKVNSPAYIVDAENSIMKFCETLPSGLHDPAMAWSELITRRCYYLDKYFDKLERSNRSSQLNVEYLSNVSLKTKLNLHSKAVDVSCQQRNFDIVRKMVSNMKMFEDFDESSNEHIMLNHCLAHFHMLQARHNRLKADRRVKLLQSAKDILESLDVNDKSTELRSSHFELNGSLYDLGGELMSSSSDNTFALSVQSVFCDMSTSTSPEEYVHDLAYKSYLNNFKLYHESTESKEYMKAYLSLAKFCDSFLKSLDNNCPEMPAYTPSEQQVTYAKHVIHCTVHAMKIASHDHQDITLRFPRLLQLVELFPNEISDYFKSEVSSLPSWLFLRWINQIVALLDKPFADAIHDSMMRLTVDYPQAVVYPISTSQPDFKYSRDQAGKTNKKFVKNIQERLSCSVPLASSFINGLRSLTSPFHTFKCWYETTIDLLVKNPRDKSKQLLTKYQQMYKQLFATERNSSQEYLEDEEEDDFSPIIVQEVYRGSFSEKFKNKVDKACGGSNGEIIVTMSKEQFQRKLRLIYKEMDTYNKTSKTPQTLKEYSLWLADFGSFNGNINLEIPGQYSGRNRPQPEYHATICGFDDRVKVMSSIQKPKVIIIQASDAKSYNYLVKGNEDLRQDQRIEQVFEVVNDVLRKDRNCCMKGMAIVSYQVIPVSSNVGLIEMVTNVVEYKDMIDREAKTSNSSCFDTARGTFIGALNKFGNCGKDLGGCYKSMMQNLSKTAAVDGYRKIIGLTKTNILRNVYLKMSDSSVSFLFLRKYFITSHAALCMVHWLLGIGDRHASNTMISTATGGVVGIDFGHAFGTATEMLPIPELMPFRLTPQIAGVMAPHKISYGLLRQYMVDCLCALRQNQDDILSVLDVFIKEPSVDWLNQAKKMHKSLQNSEEMSSEKSEMSLASMESQAERWYPLRKISIVKRKLNGCHPSIITMDEIDHNCHLPKSLKGAYKSVVEGIPDGNIRASVNHDRNLTEAEQVDCLIDQATDPNILMRSYYGWRFWM